MRNAGGNLMKGKSYQASSHIQYFAVPLPSFSSLLRRYEKSTLPPGEGMRRADLVGDGFPVPFAGGEMPLYSKLR